jgi:hypothetical protein
MKPYNKQVILILFIIILTYPFLIKYNYVAHNQYEQVTLILRYLNPSFLQNDWMVNTFFSSFSRMFYTAYMGTWAKVIPLSTVYFFHYLIMIILVTFSTFYLSLLIYKSRFISVLTSIFILYGSSVTLGGNDLIGRDLDPPRLTFAIVTTAITLYLYKKYFFSAILFGISAYLHPLIGLEVPLIFYTIIFFHKLIQSKLQFNFQKFKSLIQSILLYLLISSFAIYTYFFSSDAHPANSVNLLNLIAKIRTPTHYIPSTWPFIVYIKFFLFLIILISILRIFKKTINRDIQRIIIGITTFILIFCFIGYIFTEIFPWYPIVMSQPFRLTVLIYWFGSIIIYGGCFNIVKIQNRINKKIAYILPIVPFLLGFPPSLTQNGISFYFFLLFSILFSFFLFYLKKIKYGSEIALFGTLTIFAFTYRHYYFQFSQTYQLFTPEITLSQWVKNNTIRDAIFLVPPDFSAFRLNAQRAIVVDWQVQTLQAETWRNRIKDISNLQNSSDFSMTEEITKKGYNSLTLPQILDLQKKYHISYAVGENNITYPLKKMYRNDRYTLYQLEIPNLTN